MDSSFVKIITGQVLLIICCAFYLAFWTLSYRPGVTVNRVSGLSGLLLLVTAACGLIGVVLSVHGANSVKMVSAPKMNGTIIVAGGVIAYVVLLLITRFALSRPVTTELVLITGWAVLELYVADVLNAAGHLGDGRFFIMCAVTTAAYVTSMILYVLYYRMEPVRAFYWAMVPLITEAVSMGVLLGMCK